MTVDGKQFIGTIHKTQERFYFDPNSFQIICAVGSWFSPKHVFNVLDIKSVSYDPSYTYTLFRGTLVVVIRNGCAIFESREKTIHHNCLKGHFPIVQVIRAVLYYYGITDLTIVKKVVKMEDTDEVSHHRWTVKLSPSDLAKFSFFISILNP